MAAQTRKLADVGDTGRLAEARTQLLSAAQWLARVERSFGSGSGADFALRWCDRRKKITTSDFASDVALELDADRLAMRFTESGRPTDHEIDVEEHSPAHVEAWILIELLHRGIDRDRFSKELPYDTAGLLAGDGVEFAPAQYLDELSQIDAWLKRAGSALSEASRSRIRVAPRTLNLEAPVPGRVFGFSLGDDTIGEPFFYVRNADASRSMTAMLSTSDLPTQNTTVAVLSFFADHGATRH